MFVHCRDYLLHPQIRVTSKTTTIGKSDEKFAEKSDKKEKKIKEMSESRVKKFRKLFGQQISADEKLINYFSCALVAEILLQGHLYVSENYFSFYSNVFGYITKIVFPVSSISSITKEKTVKVFPNAIALLLSDDTKHIFGSFLSRESAYQLMGMIHRRSLLYLESNEEAATTEPEPDEVDAAQMQDAEVSSLEDSSSVSGSESPPHHRTAIPVLQNDGAIEAKATPAEASGSCSQMPGAVSQTRIEETGTVGKYNFKLVSEYNLLVMGIGLTVLLAVFSGLLLVKINAIEGDQSDAIVDDDFNNDKLTLADAESILNRNVLVVRNVRKRLEDLQEMLVNSFDKLPIAINVDQEL